jgi:hypothetical protein
MSKVLEGDVEIVRNRETKIGIDRERRGLDWCSPDVRKSLERGQTSGSIKIVGLEGD